MNQHLLPFMLLALLPTPIVHAGGGYYYGVDALSHKLDSRSDIRQTYTPPPPEVSLTSGRSRQEFTDLGLHLGYQYRRRAGQIFYIAPELSLSQFDSNSLNYTTSLKLGAELSSASIYVITGLGHIDKFDKNQFSYGLGTAIRVTDRVSINIEWQRFDTLTESTTASGNFGSQIVTTMNTTERDIDFIRFGITFYAHE